MKIVILKSSSNKVIHSSFYSLLELFFSSSSSFFFFSASFSSSAFMRFTSFEKLLRGFLRSFWGAPNSFFLPAAITSTLSELMIVCSLCAITIIVESLNAFPMIFWICCSVFRSIVAVASSRITTFDLRKIARQMQIRAFSPELRLEPPLSI